MNLLNRILHILNVKHTDLYVNKLYNEHPYKFTFFGLSKMLSVFHIDNMAFDFSDFNDLKFIEGPFVAQLGNDFVLVDNIDTYNVHYYQNDKKMLLAIDDFKEYWTGKVLTFECNENTCEPDYKKNIFNSRFSLTINAVFIVSVIFAASYLISTSKTAIYSLYFCTILIFNFVGLLCSILLSRKELKISDRYSDKLCSIFKRTNCNSVIESPGAKIAEKYSLSAIGIAYFTTSLLLLFFSIFHVYLLIINFLAFFFTIWSLWYQMFKIRLYCPLCLATCFCVWCSTALYLWGYDFDYSMFSLFPCIFVFVIYFTVIYTFALVFNYIYNGKIKQMNLYKLQSIKYNDIVFNSLLKNQKHYDTAGASIVEMGNKDGSIVVTIFSNPHCQPCQKMHDRMCEVIKQNKEIKLVYVYSSFSEELEESVKCLLYHYIHNQEEFGIIIEKWHEYGKYNRESFYKEFPYDVNDADTIEELKKHNLWKSKNQLSSTPTVIVNDYLLPQEYAVEDLINITAID